jgi:ABC-type Fe3+ transport system substrate-binding protein
VKGEEYLRKFVAQKLFITRDLRLLAENLARGKIAVTSGIGYSEFQPFIKADLPVTPLPVPKEGVYVSGGYGHLTILKNPPHPNATKVFVNWLLSRDGQEVFSRGLAQATRRNDVDTRWLRETGTIAAKDVMSADDFWQVENPSEEKFDKVRQPALKAAHALLK